MIDKNINLNSTQVFFVSKENIKNPLVSEIKKFSKKIKLKFPEGEIQGNISLSYGKRVIMTNNSILSNISDEDIIEVVDYDPVKNILLIIGRKDPSTITPIHWFIHHARDDIHAVAQCKVNNIKQGFKSYIKIDKKYDKDIINQAKHILKALRNNKNVIVNKKDIFFIGSTIKNLREDFINALKVDK